KYAALESLSPGTPGPGAAPRVTGSGSVGAYGRAYLEKLIQIQLRLPPPLPRDLRKMLVPVAGERPAFPEKLDKRKRGVWRSSSFWLSMCIVALLVGVAVISIRSKGSSITLLAPLIAAGIFVVGIVVGLVVIVSIGIRREQRGYEEERR